MPDDPCKELREALFWMVEATMNVNESDPANTNLVMARHHAREVLIRFGHPSGPGNGEGM